MVGNKVNDAVNDDSLGGPNNPLTITEGQAFEVNGFEYADGWTIVGEPVSQTCPDRQPQGHQPPRQGRPAGRQDHPLERQRGRRHVLLHGGDGIDKIPEDITVTVDCSRSDPLPAGLRQDHDQRHPLASGITAPGASAAAGRGTSTAGRRSRPGRRPAGSRGCRPRASPRGRRTPTTWCRSSAVAGEPVRGQVREVERGGDVAAAVRRDRQQRSGDRPRARRRRPRRRRASPRGTSACSTLVTSTSRGPRSRTASTASSTSSSGASSSRPARKSSSKWLGVRTSACGTTVSRMNSGIPGRTNMPRPTSPITGSQQ